MRIDNNLNAMNFASLQLNNSAQTIASSGVNQAAVSNAEEILSESIPGGDFTEAMVAQIPIAIAYEVNAKSIEVQTQVLDRLLDIKA